jgi:hypothetical protein
MERKARHNAAGDGPEAHYSNYFQVGFNAFEVIVEFGQHHEGAKQPRIHTRIVAAPPYAQVLMGLLKNALAEYEQKFGPIASA